MKVLENIEDIKNLFTCTVVTMGNFDGVHLGHQLLIKKLVSVSERMAAPALVVTFDPHPVQVLNPSRAVALLQTRDQKTASLGALGIDAVLYCPFSAEFSRMDADSFIRDFLIAKLMVKAIVLGREFRFGRDREGNMEFLASCGRRHGFDVVEFEEKEIEGKVVSSTRIREHLLMGQLMEVERLLGRPYSIQGQVVDGLKIGKEIGYPTANIASDNQFLPVNGVYAVSTRINGKIKYGAASIGVRPTIDTGEAIIDRKPVLEVHLLDFEGDLYGLRMEVFFHKLLREEKQFSSIRELVLQMDRDIDQCKALFRDV